ncbi:EspA/EspE family type VII secretion system effector [Saccharomonospora azurea]|uniref:WXG100-like domain-containing protein n=1 Tax=Saccharomonospora azurea TaxID=40988 RepID=UPI003D9211FE
MSKPLVEENTDPDNFYAADRADGDPFTKMDAPSQDGGTGFMTGVTPFEAGWAIAEGIDKGDYKLAVSGLVAGGLDVASAVTDPIGFVAGQVISWMLEHIEPARKALDDLAGNPDMVKAYAQSWTNVEEELTALGDEMKTVAPAETEGWTGGAADAYRTKAENLAGVFGSAAGAAHGIAGLTMGMAEVVNGVRTAVRDLLASIAGSLVSWSIELLCTLGTAAPVVAAQATTAIARVTNMVAKLLKALGTAMTDAITWLTVLRDLFDGLLRAINALQESRQTAPA